MNVNRCLLDFIRQCPAAYQTVDTARKMLLEHGFRELNEAERWNLKPDDCCFVTRNGSSLIAFRLPSQPPLGFMIGGCHSDSPAFRLKPEPEITSEHCVVLNVEQYGGMLFHTWFDRPLTIGGRVTVRTPEGTDTRNIYIDRDLLVLPSIAIHMDRQFNSGHAYAVQKELKPLFRLDSSALTFHKLIAEEAGAEEADVLSYDLFLCPRTPGFLYGVEEEFLCAPRIDDLQCAFALLQGFLMSEPSASVPVFALFDNEEIGSNTRQGALGTFLDDVMTRIMVDLDVPREARYTMTAHSFLVSADNAHAVHPNFPEKADPTSKPMLNGGIVIKYSGSGKYASDSVSAGLFRELCMRSEVPVQTFANHADNPGGSTLGRFIASGLNIRTVDVGLPQLAMHSCAETAGSKDTEYLIRAMKEFYASSLQVNGSTMKLAG